MLQIIGIVLVCVICVGVGAIAGAFYMGHKYCVDLVNTRKYADELCQKIGVYDLWLSLKPGAIEEYLKTRGFEKIAIYGFAMFGNRLYYELKDSSVDVAYAMDRNAGIKIADFDIKKPEKAAKDSMVDAVIVTAIFSFDAIKKNLEDYGYSNIISLYEMLYEIAWKTSVEVKN